MLGKWFGRVAENIRDREKQATDAEKKQSLTMLLTEGQFAYSRKNYDHAIDCIERAHKLAPGNYDILLNLIDLYHMGGDKYKAQETELRAQLEAVYNKQAQTALAAKDIPKAAQAFEMELKLSPRNGRIHNDLAVAYYHLHNYSKAVFHCDAALALGEKVHDKLVKALEPHR
jgi:tetratricopeptide (TPR) repeat protein